MPFQIGTDAVRRTLSYLKRGKLIFKDNVRVMTLNYNETGDYHQGARDFSHWNMCQIQYNNPNVQIVEMKRFFPTPFIRCWLDNGQDVIMDVFGKTNVEILNQLIKILGKTQHTLKGEKESEIKEMTKPISHFGSGCLRHCICEIPGQVPCSYIIRPPDHMCGKYKTDNNLWWKPWWFEE